MQPLNVSEFVDQLRKDGCEWADEIADAIDFQENSDHLELVEQIEYCTKESDKSKPIERVEWLGDRSDLLSEIEDIIKQSGLYSLDIDTSVTRICRQLALAEEMLKERNYWQDGDDLETALSRIPHDI